MEKSLSKRIAAYVGVGASQVRELQQEISQYKQRQQALDDWFVKHSDVLADLDTHFCSLCKIPFDTMSSEDDWSHSCSFNEFQDCSWYCLRPECNAAVQTCDHCSYLTCSKCAKSCETCGEVVCNSCQEYACNNQL